MSKNEQRRVAKYLVRRHFGALHLVGRPCGEVRIQLPVHLRRGSGDLGCSLPPKAPVRIQAAAYREFLDHLTMWPRARFDLRARCPAGPVSRPLRLVARPQDDQDSRYCQHAPEWPSALRGATARVLGRALGIAGRPVSTGMRSSCCLASFSGSMTRKSRKREGE